MRTFSAKAVRSLLSQGIARLLAARYMQVGLAPPRNGHITVQSRHCSSSITSMQAVAMPTSAGGQLREDKKALRKQIKQQLKQMSSEDMQQQSECLGLPAQVVAQRLD